jgi:hypothetical protein
MCKEESFGGQNCKHVSIDWAQPIRTWQHEQPHGSVIGRQRNCRHTVQLRSACARDHCSANTPSSELPSLSSISEGKADPDETAAEAGADAAEALLAEPVPDLFLSTPDAP